jgi:two-component system, OmpR family, sensor kinase
VRVIGSPPDEPAALWLAWPGWLAATWVTLWLLGVAGVVVFARWAAVPFALLMAAVFGAMAWHGRRRIAAGAEYARLSQENERLLAAQRKFLQDVSHQLRTPITIALGHSELLARSLASERDSRPGNRDIDVIVGELNRLRALSDRLLLIAAAENPDFLRPGRVALDDLAVELIGRWRPAADRDWQVGRLDAITVLADRDRLWLALDALLENAVQHTRPGDVVRLSAQPGPRPATAELVVEDTGAGIPPAELASIFDRFATGSSRAGRRGTGLGLSLVHAVAAGHGGEVHVTSTQGAGSAFQLVLPAFAARGPAAILSATTRPGSMDGG